MERAEQYLREETALDLTGAPLLGVLDELRPRIAVLPPMIVRPFVFGVLVPGSLTPNEEVAELFWAPLGTLFDPSNAVRTEVDAYLARSDVGFGYGSLASGDRSPSSA